MLIINTHALIPANSRATHHSNHPFLMHNGSVNYMLIKHHALIHATLESETSQIIL